MERVKNILVVEDDAFIALDLEDLLTDEGYNVLGPVSSVQTALSVLDCHKPDIALLDYNLGTETSRKIATALRAKSVPFVFLSGQVSHVILDGDDESQTVLPKPYKPRKLISELERAYG